MTQRLMEHVLPPNAYLYERTLASESQRLLDLDTDRLRRLWDPYRCHIDDLPYLAWSFSADIWNPNWPEAKKRSVIANAIAHHRIKGTKAGMATYLGLVDANLRDLVVPPARGYRIPAMTDEGFRKWLEKLPQIRVYTYAIRQLAGPRDFRMPTYCFRNDNFREPSIGPQIYGRKSTLIRNGQEQDIRIEAMSGIDGAVVERVFFGSPTSSDFHSVGFRGDKFYRTTTADDSIVTVIVSDDAASLSSVTTGLVPQSVKAEHIAQRNVPDQSRHFHDYSKSFRGRNFRRQSDAPLWIYDQIALHSKADLPKGLSAKSYRGHMRYGIQPFTAEATVEIPQLRSPARGFGGRFRNGFRVPTDNSRINEACDAIVAAKPLRDTVLVNTVTHRVVRLGDRRKLGSFRLGEIKRIA